MNNHRALELRPQTQAQRAREAREYLGWANTTKNRHNKQAAMRALNATR